MDTADCNPGHWPPGLKSRPGQFPNTFLTHTVQHRLGEIRIWIGSSSPYLSLRISYSLRYSFPKVPRRTATSIVLLTVLLAGISPAGVCALMCEWHAHAESQRHCSQHSDSMPGMAHNHSAMNHPGADGMDGVLVSQSCHMNCVTAERLNVWRKVVPQVTVVRSGAVVLGTTAEFLALDFTAAWGLDSSPPARPPARAASFSILRV